jgi:hypothetical protein
MNKEFIPYEQALELKELGFNEPCLSYYLAGGIRFKEYKDSQNKNSAFYNNTVCSIPLYSQAFRWFREKYGLYHTVWPEFYQDGINFNWQILWYLPKDEWTKYVISDGTMEYGDNGEYPTQEEAELACLIKLIELIKK